MPVPKLLDPLSVSGLRLKNRIVMPPMANDLATTKGEVTAALIAHYTRRAAGVGLVIVEHSYVAKDGKLSLRQLGIYEDELINGLADLAKSIRAKGTPVCIQITHAGRKANAPFAAVSLLLRQLYLKAVQTKFQENWKNMRLRVW